MIEQYFDFLKEVLNKVDKKEIDKLIKELRALRRRGGRLFVLGVGGSAANASHAVNDFRKLCGIEAYCPTDNAAELTSLVNDSSWEDSYVGWLKRSNLKKKDMIFVLSVGGGNKKEGVSLNIVKALDYAKKLKLKIAGIVGRDGGYTKEVADVCILIPNLHPPLVTSIVESMQIVILHTIFFHPILNVNPGKWESIGQK